MKVIPASSKSVTVGTQSWAALVQQHSNVEAVPSGAKRLHEISSELKAAGLPYGPKNVSRYLDDLIAAGVATEHNVVLGGRCTKLYSLSNSK